MPIKARLIHEVGLGVYLRRYLSRYSSEGVSLNPCPLMLGEHSYHTTMTLIETLPVAGAHLPHDQYPDDLVPHNDPRWPRTCRCGFAFPDDAPWQVFLKRLYDTSSGQPEPGDLYWGWRYEHEKYIEGQPVPTVWHLHGVCPNGSTWDIDGPSANGPGWTRSGEPPAITVTPSILTSTTNEHAPGTYHGWLQHGEWSDDLEGRTYPAKDMST